MKIDGERRKPPKTGTAYTVSLETGDIVDVKRNAMTMLPPSPDRCQECAANHQWDEPHNQQSLYYQMAFHATHGRYPTWTDAMAHCAPSVQAKWRTGLIEFMRKHDMPIPEDLLDTKPTGR